MPFLAAGPLLAGLGGGAAAGGGLLASLGGVGGIAGIGSSLLGGLLNNRADEERLAQASAAAEFNPQDVTSSFGNIRNRGGNIGIQADPQTELLRSLLGGSIAANLGGAGPTAGVQNQIFGAGGLGGGLSDLFGQTQQGSFGLESLLGGQLGQTNQGLGGLAGLLGGAGGGALGAGIAGLDPTSLLQQGQGFLGQAGNTQGLIDDRLSLLRQQAAPQEERQFNSLQNRLFSQGRLGSTGGSRDIEAFARGLGQADLGRQVQSQNLGLQAQNQLFGQGAGLLGLGGQQAGQLAGLGQGLLGQSGNLANQQFQNTLGFGQFGQSSGTQRLQNLIGVLGFGQGLQQQQFGQGIQGIGGISSLLAPLLSLGGLSVDQTENAVEAGGNQAAAIGAGVGGGSSAGGLLSGIGGALGGLF